MAQEGDDGHESLLLMKDVDGHEGCCSRGLLMPTRVVAHEGC